MESVLSAQLIVERFKNHLEPDEPELYYVYGQQVPSSGLQLLILVLFGWILAARNTAYATKNFFIGLTQTIVAHEGFYDIRRERSEPY